MGTNIAATSRHNYFLSHKTKLLEFYELVRNDLFDIKAALKLKHYCLTDRMSSYFKFFTNEGPATIHIIWYWGGDKMYILNKLKQLLCCFQSYTIRI